MSMYCVVSYISMFIIVPFIFSEVASCYFYAVDSYCILFVTNRYVALEDFENGIKCYQSALQVDERHYNSWYGLGVLYLRQEKFEFAEHHFRRAYNINRRSSVLMCYLGMSLHSLKVLVPKL